ncbi:MAG: ATP-binding protein [Desulfatirhabdiaceae bacterium]
MADIGKRFRNAPPKASIMIESLRGLGYNTSTAIADIIDNSIASSAKNIRINFHWDGNKSTIRIIDDGWGMDPVELDRAMRLGDKNPLENRATNDLGRFGLGLKTASFSQCRRLTVASKKNHISECLCWDLDYLALSSDDKWHLLEVDDHISDSILAPIDEQPNGTVVLWELLDRIITSGYTEQAFLDMIDRVECHLSMVFHRYIDKGHNRIQVSINGKNINPWDPFLTQHPSTWSSPVDRFYASNGLIEVQCHILPHKDRLEQVEYENAAGPEGWTAQQGFYVYRNRRLLVGGSWLGLGRGRSWTKEEAHRLARIRLDIPNTLDNEWKIDVRKSTAKPPISIRERLTKLAEDTRKRARHVFAYRGRPVHTTGRDEFIQAWCAVKLNDSVTYRIDHHHPAVSAVIEEAGPLKPKILAMLRVIEETVPVQRIWLDNADGKDIEQASPDDANSHEIRLILQTLYNSMVMGKGLSPQNARDRLLKTEPFQNYPDLVKTLPYIDEA